MNTARRMVHRSEVLTIIIISLITIVYFSWGLTSWKFSFVGDEWPFYEFAKRIAEKNFLINPFRMDGVYGEHRVLGSVWQAIFIKIFSFSPIFGWRFSSIILMIPINLFYFCWIKTYFKTSTAIISTILLDCSFYLANFFKIGYLNPIAFTLLIISLYFAARAGITDQTKDFVFLAIILGLSFYVYIGPLFPLIIWVYLLPALKQNKKKTIQNLAVLMVCYSLIVLIGILTSTGEWHAVFKKTVVKKEFSSNWQVAVNIFRNFLLFYKNYDYLYNHFVSGPYVDIVTRIFVFMGTAISLLKIKRIKYALLSLIYLMTNVVIGAASPYSYAPTTRGIFFLPFGFLLAGIALDKARRLIKWPGVVMILILILAINLYWSQIKVFEETGYHGISLVIKELQAAKKDGPSKKIVLLISDQQQFNHQNIYYLQNKYNLEQIPFSIIKMNHFSCDKIEDSFVLVFGGDDKTLKVLKSSPCADKIIVKKISHYYLY